MVKKLLSNIKSMFSKPRYSEDMDMGEQEYVELSAGEEGKAKITIRPFLLEDFSDIKPIVDSLREGYTVALINIRPLKDKDLSELKRSINKLKKTTEAIEGEIAGFGEDWIVATPAFAQIYKAPKEAPQKEQTEILE